MVAQQFRIAIVDDDTAMRRAVTRLCGASDLPCHGFASAEEFLGSEAPEHADMLILDIQLPGLSGFELHESLLKRGMRLPVMKTTGQDQPIHREKARKAGAAAYLTKPFTAAELIAAIRAQCPTMEPSPSTTPPHKT